MVARKPLNNYHHLTPLPVSSQFGNPLIKIINITSRCGLKLIAACVTHAVRQCIAAFNSTPECCLLLIFAGSFVIHATRQSATGTAAAIFCCNYSNYLFFIYCQIKNQRVHRFE